MVTEKKKFDDSIIKVAECVVGDTTGCVILLARNGKFILITPLRAIGNCQGRSKHNDNEWNGSHSE